MKKIPLHVYVARNNPRGASEVITSFGHRKPENSRELLRGLRYVLMAQGEEGYKAIANVHPDRKLIIDVHELEVEEVKPKEEVKSNTCGCSHAAGATTETVGETPLETLPVEKPQKEEPETKEEPLTKEEVKTEVKKALRETSFIKDNLSEIVLVGMGIVAIIGVVTIMKK